ncbi:MAG TPA: hypothetical protein DEB43_07510 [Desulfovibrio sp.]|nr:hypothetical protein [Desulfovibrio sp.]
MKNTVFEQNKNAMTADFPGANRSGGAIRHAGKPHPLFISAFTPLCRHCLARPFYRPFSALPPRPKHLPKPTHIFPFINGRCLTKSHILLK